MARLRVVSFIDGYNLYHAIVGLKRPHLKWLDLWALSETLILEKSQRLDAVYYFSAYAHWLKGPSSRHRQYVKALTAMGVTPILAKFKNKDRRCPECHQHWTTHEEKETDVNLALALLDGAYQDEYDRALVVTRDSDIAPAVRKVRALFPKKIITIVAPPNRGHSTELITEATDKAKLKPHRLEKCLLPRVVLDAGGNVAARRPESYDPPDANS